MQKGTKETKEYSKQVTMDDWKQLPESLRQPFNNMLQETCDDLFQKEFRKRLMWKDGELWYEEAEQGYRYSVPDLTRRLRGVQKYRGELVGPRGGLDSRNRGKEGKGLAILLLELGYLLQEDMDREAAEPLERALERFLEEHRAEDADGKEFVRQFMPVFAETMRKKRLRNSEVLQNTDRMLHRGYLEPAFEKLKSDLVRPDGSVDARADELLSVISAKAFGKTPEELKGFSRDAAVVEVLLQTLVREYFHSNVVGGENRPVEPDGLGL